MWPFWVLGSAADPTGHSEILLNTRFVSIDVVSMPNTRRLVVLTLMLFPLLAGLSTAAAFALSANTVSNTVIDVGQYSTFSVAIAGGVSPYSANWIWTFGNTITLSNTPKLAVATPNTMTISAVSTTNVVITFDGNTYPVNTLTSANTIYGPWTFTFNAIDSAANVLSTSNVVIIHSALTSGTALTQSNTVLDVGQTVTLTSNPAGGSSPYVINWFRSGSCAGTSIGTGSSFSESPSASNTYTYNVVDSATTNSVVCSASNTVTVHSPALTSGTALTQSNTVLDVGQTVTLTSNPAGGSSPYVINWFRSGSCAGTSIGTGSSFSESPSASNTYTYNVVDSATTNSVVCSASNTVTVHSPALTSGTALTQSNTVLDVGQTVTLTSNPAGGSSPYVINWFRSGSCAGTSIGTGTTFSESPSASNTYTYNVVDSATTNSVVCSASNTVTVSPALVKGIVTESNTVIDLGQSSFLTANPTGGSTPLTYKWYTIAGSTAPLCIAGNVISGAVSPTYSASPTTTNTYAYNVIDSATTNSFGCSTANTIVVDTAPTLSAVLVSSTNGVVTNDIALGDSFVVNVVVSGGSGTGNFVYSWTRNGAEVANTAGADTLSSNSISTTPSSGLYVFNIIATDNGATTPYATAQVSNAVVVGGDSAIVLTYSYTNPGTAGYFSNPTLTFTGLQTLGNQIQWNLYINGNLYGTTNSAISWTGGYESPGTYSFVFNNIGNLNYTANSLSTTLVIANLQPSGGGLPTTTTQTTVSTTIPATTTVQLPPPTILLNSTTYSNIGTTPIVISVPNSSITVSLSSSGPASATLTVSNVTASLGSGVAGTAPIIILNISTVSSANVTTTLTVGYPCSTSPSRITPYKKVPGDGWIAIRNFTVDSAACTMTFSVPPDPIVGLFSANPTTSTTTAPTTTVATTAQTTAASTTVQSQSPPVQNSNTALIALVVIVVIVVIAGAALLSRKKRRR